MLFETSYKTIVKSSEGLFKDKGSKFIAFVYAINSEADIKKFLTVVKGNHPKASHHCYAWRLGAAKTLYRTNDDGEPSGSAGKPIFAVIQSNDLTNTLIIVVRYFGGSLLGIPGLINAYKSAAADAIARNIIVEKPITEKYALHFGYEVMNLIMPKLKQRGINITKQVFREENVIELDVEKIYADSFVKGIIGDYLLKDKVILNLLS